MRTIPKTGASWLCEGIRNLHISEVTAPKLEDFHGRAGAYLTRANETMVVYFDEEGTILGVWCDFNPFEIKGERK